MSCKNCPDVNDTPTPAPEDGPCFYCLEKHISYAGECYKELQEGYSRRLQILGNLEHAVKHAEEPYPDLARLIRDQWKQFSRRGRMDLTEVISAMEEIYNNLQGPADETGPGE